MNKGMTERDAFAWEELKDTVEVRFVSRNNLAVKHGLKPYHAIITIPFLPHGEDAEVSTTGLWELIKSIQGTMDDWLEAHSLESSRIN